jgi:hypothetical protein
MLILWLLIPLAVVAIAIAVVPVMVGSVRHDRSVKEGEPASTALAAREANRWHVRLGRRTRRMPRELEPGRNATIASDRRH